MFGSKKKVAEAGQVEYVRTVGGTPATPVKSFVGGVLLSGGAGTPCSASLQPSPAAIVQQAANAASSKKAEAERKKDIENAAAKRCASGKVFPGTPYRLDMTIGKGSYGRVKLATDLRTGQQVAIKFLAKDLMTKQAHWIRVRREINLLTLAYHPHIIRVHEWLEASEDVLLVMEYVTGKDLFDRINEKSEKRYAEEEARPIFRQMVSALDYCHRNRIVHRDLKPENVMIDAKGVVKLIDFGFANLFHPRDHLATNCGSPLYAAPEIVQAKPYIGPEVDVWSLGIVLYAMIVGALPFEDENLKGLYKKIGEGKFTFPEHVSPLARDLIQSMLQVNVLHRATMTQVRVHPWVTMGYGGPPDSYLLRPNHIPCPREDLIRQLPEYGYSLSIDAVRSAVVYQPDSHVYAGYCLLEEKERREVMMMNVAANGMSNFMPVNSNTSRYIGTPVKQTQPLASSMKDYHYQQQPQHRPIAPAIDPTWVDIDPMYVPRYSVALDSSMPFSSVPQTPVKGPNYQHHQPPPSNRQSYQRSLGIQHPSATGSTTGHSNIMAQAAATVVNKFKKLRDIRFGLGSDSQRASRRDSRQHDNAMQM